ncbi:MAG: transposase [Gemmatimonadetes bacterium]|nr:transposase [Gemmatimonadota bacterium]
MRRRRRHEPPPRSRRGSWRKPERISRLALSRHRATWIEAYNTQRPHRSLNGQTPAQRLAKRNKTAAAYITRIRAGRSPTF